MIIFFVSDEARLYGCNALHVAMRDLKNMCAKDHDNLKFSQTKR